ncbi:hypothetical protein D3C71_1498790 [compost metagenome]
MNDHYSWLDKNLPEIFEGLGLDTRDCESLIVAHGDKCYSAERVFQQNGIHFYHGCAMYLLTRVPPYCHEVRDTPNGWVDPFQWIVKNKNKFLKHFPAV